MNLCQYCSLNFETSNILNIHLSLVHPNESNSNEKRDLIEDTKADKSNENIIEDVKKENTHKCNFCPAKFPYKYKFNCFLYYLNNFVMSHYFCAGPYQSGNTSDLLKKTLKSMP